MKKGIYGRSLLWLLVFFGLPVALFVVMLMEVSHWEKPEWGPEPLNQEKAAPQYQQYRTTTMVLAMVGAIPYLWLLLTFAERLQLTDKAIRRKRLFRNRKLLWEDVIECRDYLNYIQLVPMYKSSALYVDYYATFNKHRQLSRLITRKCREVEANIMVGRRRRRLVVCDFGVVPTLIFIAASAVLLLYFRQRIAFLGMVSGVVMTLLSAWIWLITHRNPRRWRSGGYIHFTFFVLALILPPAYFAQQIDVQRASRLMALGTYGVFYLSYFVGLLAGSGLMSALLPSRKRR